MIGAVTFCVDCDHSIQSGPPWRWECRKHERHESFGFVTKTKWDKFSPFMYCNSVNGGNCLLFEPRKEIPE